MWQWALNIFAFYLYLKICDNYVMCYCERMQTFWQVVPCHVCYTQMSIAVLTPMVFIVF